MLPLMSTNHTTEPLKGVTAMDGRTQRSLAVIEARTDIANDLAGLSIAYPGAGASDPSLRLMPPLSLLARMLDKHPVTG